jgi:transposase
MTDGFYCLKTNLPRDRKPDFLVSAYRQRRKVDVSFHYLKSFVEIRPLYHQKEERIRAHITICILSYLLQVTAEYLLCQAGFALSFQDFISHLTTRRVVELNIKNMKSKRTLLPEIPKEITSLLVALKINPQEIKRIKLI